MKVGVLKKMLRLVNTSLRSSFALSFLFRNISSIYDFTATSIDGQEISFVRFVTRLTLSRLNAFNGKVLMIVNVASECGYTDDNYEQLERIYQKYKDAEDGFEVLGFPCNQFGAQEPGTDLEIKDVICTVHGNTWPIFGKVKVNGKEAHPLYVFLKASVGGILVDGIKWNFSKFIVDKSGQPRFRYGPETGWETIEENIDELMAEEQES